MRMRGIRVGSQRPTSDDGEGKCVAARRGVVGEEAMQ